MIKITTIALTISVLSALPMAVSAQSSNYGPEQGERELSISGTGSTDRDFNSGTFGVTGDMGWYVQDHLVAGVRQSINYTNIEGENIIDDFWNGSTRGYVNHHFLDDRARPFVGASLGALYGDGVRDSAFAGLETGIKYYVLAKTYFLARAEYQFLFNSANDVSDAFQDDGAWAYTVGLGYNF